MRHIEGASQRIQEDTMRFASIMKTLGVSVVDAVMTLIAFLPVLIQLSENVKTLPLIGEIAHPLFFAAILAFFVAYIPLIGTIAGFKGAMDVWGWSFLEAGALFFGPFLVIVLLAFLSSFFEQK